jgi:hypothetical protein
VAGAAQVDDAQARFVLVSQHNVLRFEIAVDEIVARQKEERLKDLDREAMDQLERETFELVQF